jgi:hypothetical protein
LQRSNRERLRNDVPFKPFDALGGPSRGTQTVTSTTSVNSGGGQRFITGGVVINLTSGNRVTPYAMAGAGVIVNYGSSSAQVNGTYQFQVVPLPIGSGPPAPTFHETDAVTVSASTTNAAVGVFGFGAKIASAGRWGVRIDARDYLSGNSVTPKVTAAPASQISQPTGIFVLGTSPPLQFSTVSGTPSTLSQPVSSFTTFNGTGVRNHVFVTAGIFWRF